jgi:thermitase
MNYRFFGVLTPVLVLSVMLWADDPPTALRGAYLPDEVIVKLRTAGTAAGVDARSIKTLGAGQSISDPWARFQSRIEIRQVRPLRRGTSPAGRSGVRRQSERSVRKAAATDLNHIYKLEVELGANQSLEDVIAILHEDPTVEYAERNQIVSIDYVPNDPYFSSQWFLANTGQAFPIKGGAARTGTAGADIAIESAWDVDTGQTEVVVAVLDTGVDYHHRDLANRMWINAAERDGDPDIDDDRNGYVDDIYGYNFAIDYYREGTTDPLDDSGHGTLCAGIIAAEMDNGVDIAGICPAARIMAVKNLNAKGNGDVFSSAEAIYYAVDNGADVISCSWGFASHSMTMEEAVNYAYSQGVLAVVSAGNQDSSKRQYPAAYDAVISVAATDANDQRTSFSSYGDWVDVAAPGTMILSLRAHDTDMYINNDDYVPGDRFFPYGDPNATMYIASGTSVACPIVAGVAALVRAQRPQASLEEIRDRLLLSADDLSDLNPEYVGLLGSGRVDAFRAVSPTFRGALTLDREVYNGRDSVQIRLTDFDLVGQTTTEVRLSTDQGEREVVSLHPSPDKPWLFEGTIATSVDPLRADDGRLQLVHGEMISAHYEDPADEHGDVVPLTATARADTVIPHLAEIRVETQGALPRLVIRTDEPATVRIIENPLPGGTAVVRALDLSLAEDHVLFLAGISDETEYHFIVELTDQAGNTVTDDNQGLCYGLKTVAAGDVHVPGQYATIQEAIDNCWPGYTVWVADGTYTGTGNRDIEFRGKAITVSSENGPENCIIDCQGTETEPHRGFFFHDQETSSSVLCGFTIVNGWASEEASLVEEDVKAVGGAILCYYAEPLIENCVFANNYAIGSGGALACCLSDAHLIGNTFTGNTAQELYGGGLCVQSCKPFVRDCQFKDNQARLGGAVYVEVSSSVIIANCHVSGNSADGGPGLYNWGSVTITDCMFMANRSGNAISNDGTASIVRSLIAANEGPGVWTRGTLEMQDCIIRDNRGSGLMCDTRDSTTLRGCLIFGNHSTDHAGGIDCRSCTVTATHCRLIGNRSDAEGGAIDCRTSMIDLAHCVLAGNSGPNGAIHAWQGADIEIRDCTLLDNESLDDNPAIYLSDTNDRLVLVDSIVRNHGVEQIGYRRSLPPENIQISYTNIQGGWEGLGNIDEDPLFVDATSADPNDWDLNLRPGSPCIDGGSPDTRSLSEDDLASVLDGDGDGVAVSDMGAFEYYLSTGMPVMAVSTSEITFAAGVDGPNPAGQEIRIHNVGGGVLDFIAETDPLCQWLVLDRSQGTVDAVQGHTLDLAVDVQGLGPGQYHTDVILSSPSAFNSPVTISVELYVSGSFYVPASYASIQSAIEAAQSGATIIVSPGRYVECIDFGGKDLVLTSVDPEDAEVVATTVIDGHQAGSVVTFSGSETPLCRLSGFTITGGRIAPVYDDDGDEERTHDGAGVRGNGTHATISRCTITGNVADSEDADGGGMADCDGVIAHCVISDNRAIHGGGLESCSGTIADCTISGNVSEENGGGVFGSSAEVVNCVVSANTSLGDNGGGLASVHGHITNCLIVGNRSEGYDSYGGGLDRCTGPIRHCTVVGNIARSWGGGISRCYGPIVNCVIAGNYAGVDGQQLWWSSAPSHSCFPGARDNGNIDVDPGFVNPGYWDTNGTPWDVSDDIWHGGDYHLTESSACLDAGANLPDVTTDFAGTPRPVDGNADGLSAADMGCYEWNPLGRSLPVLEVESRSFEFAADADGPAPETQFLRLRNWGSGGLHWQLAENCAWLTVTPSQGQAGVDWTALELSANQAGLKPGDYSCALEIQSEDAVNSPSRIEIALRIQGPEFGFCPRHLEWTLLEGQSLAPAVLSVRNHGSGMVHWRLSHDSPWLQIRPSEGSLAAAQAERVDIDVNVSGFAPGRYQTSLRVSDDVGEGHEQVVSVIVNVVSRQLQVPRDYPTIQSALDAAIDGCTVVVADGTYTGPGNRELRFQGKALTLQSENGPAHCIIDCEQQAQGFRFEDFERADSILEGFTILNGRGDLGGGILISRASPTIRNCHILHCQSDQGAGGGIYAGPASSPMWTVEGVFHKYSSLSIIESCVISYNTADDGEHGGRGGGICLDVAASVEVRDCVISSNVAADHGGDGPTEAYAGVGGGVFCGRGPEAGASLGYDDQLIRCVITDNAATWGQP